VRNLLFRALVRYVWDQHDSSDEVGKFYRGEFFAGILPQGSVTSLPLQIGEKLDRVKSLNQQHNKFTLIRESFLLQSNFDEREGIKHALSSRLQDNSAIFCTFCL
jgi:hypothetical protein